MDEIGDGSKDFVLWKLEDIRSQRGLTLLGTIEKTF